MKSKWVLFPVVILVALLSGAMFNPAYILVLSLARLTTALYGARMAAGFITGRVRGFYAFLGGLGGALYIVALIPDLLKHPIHIAGRDVPFLARAIGIAFLFLPLLLQSLPQRVQRHWGMGYE